MDSGVAHRWDLSGRLCWFVALSMLAPFYFSTCSLSHYDCFYGFITAWLDMEWCIYMNCVGCGVFGAPTWDIYMLLNIIVVGSSKIQTDLCRIFKDPKRLVDLWYSTPQIHAYPSWSAALFGKQVVTGFLVAHAGLVVFVNKATMVFISIQPHFSISKS